ncbi:translation initiation factor IF-2 N-terminal domain-containing protein [Priestia megaterium]|uniref:translation initiation factor IF-2 N-terminal domain-containing protein n=1 Tax=Priestia megaterium TaxID=1404 RepID=UPI002453715C|nr:translation initiation factor IF-2 N-terminal domain-containing protein [Priestia megaterium]MDH3180939.1 translation initiation factor IF-2 N-terminal domain-containing protein [Priestia megaterium]
MKVYELASLLGLTNNQMLEILWEHSIDVKGHMSTVEEEIQQKLINELMHESKSLSHKNKSSLKFVEIKGLFYKYNYSIDFEKDVNILIAENGFGKTTILNIIVGTLTQDIKKLKKLPFKSIKVGIKDTVIEIHKDELNNNSLTANDRRMLFNNLRNYLPESVYKRLMLKQMANDDFDEEELLYLLRKYTRESPLYNDFRDLFIRGNSQKNNSRVRKTFNQIHHQMKEEVLYFPTYRRIEEELDSFVKLTEGEKSQFKSKLDRSTINFGIEDVEVIINELTDKLKQDAINHYSKMNGEILDDLLSNKVELTYHEKRKIDLEKVKIVVGRIGKDRIKELDKLMSFIKGDSEVENKSFLQYYLFKLISIYERQKSIDEKIKKYRDVCNGYLVNKEIIYDEVVAEVKIVDKESQEKINFSYLSSGEKQILSLFSRLYLNTLKSAIFIIDEPELSLSIVWQKKLLEDIYASGKIALIIATTHSPFIFKNSFRTFAQELKLFRELGDTHE